jgi:hypothetical protein
VEIQGKLRLMVVEGTANLATAAMWQAEGQSETVAGGVPCGCHPKIRRLHDYWLSIRPPSGLPGRQHFDPLEIPSLLRNIVLIDAPAPPGDLVFRLMGTQLEVFFGGNFTGRPLTSAYKKNRASRAYRDVSAIIQDSLPRWRRGPASFVDNREHVTTERLYVPLAADGATVDMILGILLAKVGDEPFA